MSRDTSSTRFFSKTSSKNKPIEGNENEFGNESTSFHHLPPARSPLNGIPDPSQFLAEHEGFIRANRSSETKFEGFDARVSNLGTPRVSGRGKAHSEPNSAQSTPSRRFSSVVVRPPQHCGARVGSSTKVCRGISLSQSEQSIEVPHFELVEDPSFWKDHNVQVLIRIRPLSNTEMVSQGYGQCLRQESAQTLVWLGHPETRFTFDHVACETISQEKLFRTAGLPMVDNCMSGYNSCMFAYGQTGSGKTYTMMGEINQKDGQLSEDCGITPRIFEYLFSKIIEEEEVRKDERLKYSCKCSFLEIYNEQITDLLEPSSVNLQLREDLKKGVHVENLSEHSVGTVNDVLKLLLQGAANRKMAATHMNSESSRSHSVFTCTVESSWEKDSMTHIRFGRLNLVDLAGSERQKSSGAEGDRLKEAANINKSLSTLGLVIMSLVDLAHGKHRHVPYRDSRLTFLLQDSLGGNSKTAIIANVSPSVCSANETLSTLKFAQRAKLIQNNAKVNEDASGNVTALQRQIQQLQGQLSFLMKHYDNARPETCCPPSSKQTSYGGSSIEHDRPRERNTSDNQTPNGVEGMKLKRIEATLFGALRREKSSETIIRRLESQIEQINHLAQQREEEAQHANMMLRFSEEKMKGLQLVADKLVSADKYLVEENNILKEEIQLLRERIDRNPELTQFAVENIKLQDQLRLLQEFYEHGERENLLDEISEMRDQLLENLEGYCGQQIYSSETGKLDNDIVLKLERCEKSNFQLKIKVDQLQAELRKYNGQGVCNPVTELVAKNWDESGQKDKCLLVKPISTRSDQEEEITSNNQGADENAETTCNPLVTRCKCPQADLTPSRFMIKTEQDHLIKDLEFADNDSIYTGIIASSSLFDKEPVFEHEDLSNKASELQNKKQASEVGGGKVISSTALTNKLDRIIKELDEARSLNCKYQEDQESQVSRNHQIGLVCEQVEMETAKTILHLQEEVDALQAELQEKLYHTTEENKRLRDMVAAKNDEIKALCVEWERATLELTSFLIEGSRSLSDASSQIESIACSFPHVNIWLSDHVERAAKICVEKEQKIIQLQRSLGDAQKMVLEMNHKLISLKGAALALTEVQQQENDSSNNKTVYLEKKLMYKEDRIIEAENHKNAELLEEKSLSDCAESSLVNCAKSDAPMSNLFTHSKISVPQIPKTQIVGNALPGESQVDQGKLLLLESGNGISTSYPATQCYLSPDEKGVYRVASPYKGSFEGCEESTDEMKVNFVDLKMNSENGEPHDVKVPSLDFHPSTRHEDLYFLLERLRNELHEINITLNRVTTCNEKKLPQFDTLNEGKRSPDVDNMHVVEPSGSSFSAECFSRAEILEGSSSARSCSSLREIINRNMNVHCEEGSVLSPDDPELHDSQGPINSIICDKTALLHLGKELKKANDTFIKLNLHLAVLFRESGIGDVFDTHACAQKLHCFEQNIFREGLNEHSQLEARGVRQPSELKKLDATADCDNMIEGDTFFNKFEEAHATMKEADIMLNTLLKANENAKELTGTWKQAGIKLMMEKSDLISDITQLQSLISLKNQENEALQSQVHINLLEVTNLVALLENSLVCMKSEVEESINELYSDAICMVKDILGHCQKSRSSLEDIYSEIMSKGFASLVIYQCHVEKILDRSRVTSSPSFRQSTVPRSHLLLNAPASENGMKNGGKEYNSTAFVSEDRGSARVCDKMVDENQLLKIELRRKEEVLKGLLFDFSLLQESASTMKDTKDEMEKLAESLSQVQGELEMKTNQLNKLLVENTKLYGNLMDTEAALVSSNSELEQARETVDILSDENAQLRVLLKDVYLKKSDVEGQLEEQREVVRNLENEILRRNSSEEKKLLLSIEEIEDDLRRVTIESDQLRGHVNSLQHKLEMAYSLADENEAVAVEARQESEASKVYAEQKEEEVKILEYSVQELESTVNVLEKKVYEMEEEVEKQKVIRDSLELELQALKRRMTTVESFTETMGSESSCKEDQVEDGLARQLHRKSLELHEAQKQIKLLEQERDEQISQVKQCKDYISELVLHAEAQASQYQQKYKTLEAMVREVKSESTLTSATLTLDKTDKITMRPRGSGSPFRCITNLVQQMNLEKDQELSMARHRVEELEALATSRQKEVCMLNARLAATENMTHDVIRDLLGVKVDMTNYANLIEQYHVQKLVEDAQQQVHESMEMEQEILNLRRQIDGLLDERERCIAEVNRRQADTLDAQVTVEQLQERDQLITAQNEMLKVDNHNLKRRIAENDEMLKKLFGQQTTALRIQKQKNKEKISFLKQQGEGDLGRRVANSEKRLLHVNDELARYHSSDGTDGPEKSDRRVTDRKFSKNPNA